MKKLSVIIPVLNHLEYTRQIYEDIRNKLYYYPGNAEIIFINNGSTDWTYEYLHHIQEAYEDIIIIDNPINVWVTIAWNQWIDIATGEFLLVLNNDIFLPYHIDKKMVEMYSWKIICPYTKNWFDWDPFYQLSNINWTCWMIKKSDYVIRMDERLKIWFSDDFLYHTYGCDWIMTDYVNHIGSVTLNSTPWIQEMINNDREQWKIILKDKWWTDTRFQ